MSAQPAVTESYLPKAVRKQVEIANQLVEEIYKAPEGAEQPQTTGSNAPSEPANTAASEGGDPVSTSTAEAAAKPAAAPAQPESTSTGTDAWEHKYKVLQGKYNSEVPRLNAQISGLSEANTELRRRLANLETIVAAQAGNRLSSEGAAAPAPTAQKRKVSDEEVNAFGPDLYDFIKRTAAEVTEEEVERRTAPVVQKIQQVEQTASRAAQSATESARERMIRQLAEAVPAWEQQNTDPAFLAWLGETDPFSGVERGRLLADAYGRNDAQRVIAFFTRFQQENAAVTNSPLGDAAPGASEPQRTLGEFVAPGTPKTGPASAPSESGKRVYTRQEIKAFYDKRNELVRRGRPIPEAMAKFERDITKAVAEGRVA